MQVVVLEPIGEVRSTLSSPDQAPRQGAGSGQEAVIELDPAWVPALEGLEPGRDLWVVFHFHLAGPPSARVHPRGDRSRPLTGLFNTRSPRRPAPLGLTLVRLLALEGNRLRVRGLEAVDGTPILDLKPYVPLLDQPQPEETP